MNIPKDIRDGLSSYPSDINQLFNLSKFYEGIGRNKEAIKVYKKILSIMPDNTNALLDVVRLLNQIGRSHEADEIITNSVIRGCNDIRVMNQYALILKSKGLINESIEILSRNIQKLPDYPETYLLLGNIMSEIGVMDSAIALYKTSLYYNNSDCVSYNNLAIAYKDNHQVYEALENFQKAISLCPQDPYIHWNYAFTLLLSGNYEKGFKEYEWRWLKPDYKVYERFYDAVKWDGSEGHKSIIIYAEQGMGDTIQFSRYAQKLASNGLRVTIHCQKELVRLMKNVIGVDSSVSFDEKVDKHDCYSPIMSLPFILKTNINNIPRTIPYIKLNDDDVMRWSGLMNSYKNRLKVGIVWAGNPAHPNDKRRSMPFEFLLPLFKLKDVVFFNLQIGKNRYTPTQQYLVDFSSIISDFYDTACLINCLDLIISVDTAVCHLSGALGKDVWVMLPFSPDWRWMLDIKTSIWYPTARIFRQHCIDNWKGVIENIKIELEKLL